MHLLDVLENSAKAGAPRVEVRFSWHGGWLHIDICDNGPGLPPEVAADPANPYSTTRRERKVGLGLGLLRQAAEMTGGSLAIASRPGQGVTLAVEINLASIDARPLGDLADSLATAAIAWPGTSLVVGLAGCEPCLDMALVHDLLDGVPVSHPSVRNYLTGCLREGLAPLMAWAGQVEVDMGVGASG